MRLVRVMIITVILGLATGFLPNTSLAHDVSVGISFGLPLPVVEVYHALPPPPPPPPWAFYHDPPYRRYAYAYRPYSRYYRDHEWRGKGQGYYKREERRHRYNNHDD